MNFHSGAYQYNDIKVSFHTLPPKKNSISLETNVVKKQKTHTQRCYVTGGTSM